MNPKVFISYSWTSQRHQALIQEWAERLMADGVDVVLDIFELKEGHDKYKFMERMATDSGVTHVLVFCDKLYAEKADARKAGVGTESQIISKEVYEKVEQSKFIPIACEVDTAGEPYLPVFFKARIWMDFSSPEAVNENWERLIRLLFGKPLIVKPTLGKPPAYIDAPGSPADSPVVSKYAVLRQAILQGKKGLSLYRRDFLDSCIKFADELRVRARPEVKSLGEKVLEDCGKLKIVRNHIIDWILLEGETTPQEELSRILVEFLEQLRALKGKPPELNSWNDAWFEAHSLFVYETFLYIVAALLKTGCFHVLHEILSTHYLLPEEERRSSTKPFNTFGSFYGYSETLQSILAPAGKRLYSPAAELLKRQADRTDLPFSSLMEADLLILLMACLTPDTRWYPQTLHYAPHRHIPSFFLRATQHRHFLNMAIVTGVPVVESLRESVKAGLKGFGADRWNNFWLNNGFAELMNLEQLDTLK